VKHANSTSASGIVQQHCSCTSCTHCPIGQVARSQGETSSASGEKKLWGGRFTGKTDPLMEKFNESLPFDKRMWAEDLKVIDAVTPAFMQQKS